MKLTNELDLPQPLVDAVVAYQGDYEASDQRKADISVTTLLTPPQIVQLRRQYEEQLVEDASERIWALLGHAIHQILERADSTGITEHRLYIERNGWLISGMMDRLGYEERALQDYKVCSVWEHIGGLKPERVEQLNLLAHMAREEGYQVDYLQIVAIYRDWSKAKAQREDNYPKGQVQVIPVPVWSPEECEAFLMERVKEHQAARMTGQPRPCTPEEQWARPTKYAVMKKGAKKAIKLHDLAETADEHARQVGGFVEYRPGMRVRCNDYCPVRAFCPQRRAEMGT